MNQKKAAFRASLEIACLNTAIESLNSKLFRKVEAIDIDLTSDRLKPNFNKLASILYSNYTNPKAMNCFIFYDITDNKLRVLVAKYLLERGCQRIQKSVFLANISKKIYLDIFNTFTEMEPVFSEYDSLFMVPIGEYHLAEVKMIGKDVDMSFSKAKQHVLYF